jgi:hypothetical protein
MGRDRRRCMMRCVMTLVVCRMFTVFWPRAQETRRGKLGGNVSVIAVVPIPNNSVRDSDHRKRERTLARAAAWTARRPRRQAGPSRAVPWCHTAVAACWSLGARAGLLQAGWNLILGFSIDAALAGRPGSWLRPGGRRDGLALGWRGQGGAAPGCAVSRPFRCRPHVHT